MSSITTDQLAAAAARLIVEEGLEYGPAKRKAARALGQRSQAEWPSNEAVEDEVRAHLNLFHADSQPKELALLRQLALQWMDQQLAEFRPHLAGAVWRGTATRLSDIHIDLYCDDPKSAEIALINQGVRYAVQSAAPDAKGQPREVLCIACPSPDLAAAVTIFLAVHDLDDLRGALKADAQGRTVRGNTAALRRLVLDTA